jgi:hypothetical protein
MPADPSLPDAAAPLSGADGRAPPPGRGPAAGAGARAAARRSGIPLAVWLSGLIHAVADHEEGGDHSTAGP